MFFTLASLNPEAVRLRGSCCAVDFVPRVRAPAPLQGVDYGPSSASRSCWPPCSLDSAAPTPGTNVAFGSMHSTSVQAQGHICLRQHLSFKLGHCNCSMHEHCRARCAVAGGRALGSSDATRSSAGQYPFTSELSSFLSIARKCRMSCGGAPGAHVPAREGSQLYSVRWLDCKQASWTSSRQGHVEGVPPQSCSSRPAQTTCRRTRSQNGQHNIFEKDARAH